MKILYILSTYNIYGGTPKKTLDLISHSKNDCYLYMYEDGYNQYKYLFEEAGAKITEGYYKRNIFKHINSLLNIIDKNEIQLVQAQFTMGEVLGSLIKYFRPQIKLIIALVGPFKPKTIKKVIVQYIYRKADAFVFISNYVKTEKCNQFPLLAKKESKIIFNGTEKRQPANEDFANIKRPSLCTTCGLVKWKNIDVIIEALNILRKKGINNVYFYIVGDGYERRNIEEKINQYNLEKQVFILGYQKNIGALLKQADIYVHPAYAEGFGIAVAEAMQAGKPIIAANAGALPELIENGISGLLVDPFHANEWADAILTLLGDKQMANELGSNAKKKAQCEFSTEKYVNNYQELYKSLLEE
jgi:glycosyltransferase involved in cell wall biosynthesis